MDLPGVQAPTPKISSLTRVPEEVFETDNLQSLTTTSSIERLLRASQSLFASLALSVDDSSFHGTLHTTGLTPVGQVLRRSLVQLRNLVLQSGDLSPNIGLRSAERAGTLGVDGYETGFGIRAGVLEDEGVYGVDRAALQADVAAAGEDVAGVGAVGVGLQGVLQGVAVHVWGGGGRRHGVGSFFRVVLRYVSIVWLRFYHG